MRLRDRMPPATRWRYLLWRAANSKRPMAARLISGEKLRLRPPPSSDLDTAYEVFVLEPYRSQRLKPATVRRIVDLGANVGYSVLYFAVRFPAAQVDAFEPHPEHVRSLKAHVETNSLSDRVKVWPHAAGNREAQVRLQDAGNRSRVGNGGSIAVRQIDFLQWAVGQKIDLLKIDIEGGEAEIIFDSRFAALDVAALVMEWHSPPVDEGQLANRLSALGYEVEQGQRGGYEGIRTGIMWGFRKPR